ncbi:MAG TPA: TlpA disulfide reductase family protein [Streptosporangiaceae bacterium]|nr:TlpA disulfide reductase family protein [Streptosporangiaceae bacterium]
MSWLPVPARIAIGAAVAALLGLATAGCDSGQIAADVPQSSGQSFVGHSYESTFYQVGQRSEAPTVSGTTVTGQRLNLDSYRGKTIVLNFWGSWCDPCRAEAPALGTLARQLQPDGVRFVGVDIRDEPDSALAFMQNFNVSYPSLNDPNDEIALEFQSTVPPSAIPTTLIIDRSGRIAARIVGASTYAELKDLVAKVAGLKV